MRAPPPARLITSFSMNAESPPQPLSGPPSPTLRAQIWEARRENARLKAELEAEAAAARSPDPAKANSTTEKAAVETAETVENASPPGPLKVPLAPTAHPVLRAAIVLMVKSGNAPRPPKEIAALLRTAIDNQVTPDLGHLFDADPAGTVSMTLSGYVSSCAREGKRCAIGREKAERGSLYYVDVVGADRANDVEVGSAESKVSRAGSGRGHGHGTGFG